MNQVHHQLKAFHESWNLEITSPYGDSILSVLIKFTFQTHIANSHLQKEEKIERTLWAQKARNYQIYEHDAKEK